MSFLDSVRKLGREDGRRGVERDSDELMTPEMEEAYEEGKGR